MSVFLTDTGVYRAFEPGAWCNDERFRLKTRESGLVPRRQAEKEDRYVEYGIAGEES